MAKEEVVEGLVCPLKDKRVHIKLIKRTGSWLQDINEEHDGAHLWSNASIGFKGLPFISSLNRHADPLTKGERDWFESDLSGLDIGKNAMSVLKKDNYWTKFSIRINRNGLSLDLNEPVDYLRYKFLLVQPQIAPTWEERFDKADYKFAIVDADVENRQRAKERDKKTRANRIFGRMDHSIEKMKDFLMVYHDNRYDVPEDASREFVIGEIDKIIEENIDKFLDILEDEHYDIKIFIQKCIAKGSIFKEGAGKYVVAGEEDTFSMRELIEFLTDRANQKVYGKLKAQLLGEVKQVPKPKVEDKEQVEEE